MKKLLCIFLTWFVVSNLFALLSQNRVQLLPDTAYPWINAEDAKQMQGWNPIPLHAKWDSFWYLDIAKNGYSLSKDNTLANIVFFPLYPLLMGILGFFVGNLVLAGWIVSSVFLFLGLWYLFKLTKEFHPDIDPYLPIIFLLIFPTAFFLNGVYTESLFLFLSVATFYYAKKGNFFFAGLFGFGASLTRVTGVLLALPLFFEVIKQGGGKIRALFQWKVLAVGAPALGLASFFAFHWVRFGDPLLFFKIEAAWGRAFNIAQEHFVFSTSAALSNFLLDVFFVGIAVVSTVWVLKRFGFSYAGYMAATLAIALSTGTLMSIGRYILVLFPMFLLLASFKSQYFRYAWTFISLLLLALYTLLFVNYYWAG